MSVGRGAQGGDGTGLPKITQADPAKIKTDLNLDGFGNIGNFRAVLVMQNKLQAVVVYEMATSKNTAIFCPRLKHT